MGILDLFKRKKATHKEKVNLAYECFRPEHVKQVFPNGVDQADKIIQSLGKVYQIELNEANEKKYFDILSSYAEMLLHRVVTQSTNESIMNTLLSRHPDLVRNKAMAAKALAYVSLNMMNHDYMLSSSKEDEMLLALADAFASEDQIRRMNAKAETENKDNPDYGLIETMPIYTKDAKGSNQYLSMLRSSLGDTLKWERVGSKPVNGINGLVDVYTSKLSSGEEYLTLYINMYGSANSTSIPQGFLQVSEEKHILFNDIYKEFAWRDFAEQYEKNVKSFNNLYLVILRRFEKIQIGADGSVRIDLNNPTPFYLYELEFSLFVQACTDYITDNKVVTFNHSSSIMMDHYAMNKQMINQAGEMGLNSIILSRRLQDYRNGVKQKIQSCASAKVKCYSVADMMAAVLTDCVIASEITHDFCAYKTAVASCQFYAFANFARELYNFAVEVYNTVAAQVQPYMNTTIMKRRASTGKCPYCGTEFIDVSQNKCSVCGTIRKNSICFLSTGRIEENKTNKTADGDQLEPIDRFYNDCLIEFHAVAKENGMAKQGVIIVPELIPIGEKVVNAFMQDRFFKHEFKNDISKYNYAIMALSLQAGIALADKWRSDSSVPDSHYVDEIIVSGPADACKLLLIQLGLTDNEKENQFYRVVYKKMGEKQNEYREIDDTNAFLLRANLAAYQLGVSMILDEYDF